MKIMFDSNSFDKMWESDEDLEKIITSSIYTYYITSIQIEEIGNIPDKYRETRIKNLLALCKIRAHLLYTPAVVGFSRIGNCVLLSDEDIEIYKELLKETKSNIMDALIGTTAKREGCTIVTDDNDFSKKLKKCSVPTMTYNEFAQSL